MDDELREKIKDVLKDPTKRHKFEAALIKEAANRVHKKVQKLKEKAQDDWPEVKDHIQDFIEDLPKKAQKVKDGATKVTKFAENTIKDFIDWALKNNKNKALVLAGLMALSGGVVLLTTQQSRELKKAQKEEKIRLKNLEDKLNQKHAITDKKSYDQLFNEALPLIQASFLTSEVYVSKPYTDNGKVINTIGAGSWWYPQNGDPKSTTWIRTSEYVKQHKGLTIDGNQAMNLVPGWACNREDGRVNNQLRKELQETELSIREFAAIFGVVYNSEKAGWRLCREIKKDENYKDPMKIAKCIMNLKYDEGFENGMLRRNAAQSTSIITDLDHCAMHSKKIVQKNKSDVYVTSISVLPLSLCQEFKDALNAGNNQKAEELSQKIKFKMEHWLCRHDENGQSALRQVQKEVKDTAVCNPICRFAGDTLNVTGDSPYWGDVLYDQAREFNECGLYDSAAIYYENLFNRGFYGADLYLDAARNYYDKGDYNKCCNLCKKICNNKDEIYQNMKAYQLAYNAYKQNNQPGLAKACKQKLDSLSTHRPKKVESR